MESDCGVCRKKLKKRPLRNKYPLSSKRPHHGRAYSNYYGIAILRHAIFLNFLKFSVYIYGIYTCRKS